MDRDHGERRAGPLDGGDQRDVAPGHALEVELDRLGARQLDAAQRPDRPARQQRDAEQALLVAASGGGPRIVVASGGGLEEQRGPGAVAPQRRGEVARDVAVSGPRHPQVHLVERHDVGRGQIGMVAQRRLDPLVAVAMLDVPLRDPDARGVTRRRGHGLGRVATHGREHALEPGPQSGPLGGRAQLAQRCEARERLLQGAALGQQGGIARHAPPPSRVARAWRRCTAASDPLDLSHSQAGS